MDSLPEIVGARDAGRKPEPWVLLLNSVELLCKAIGGGGGAMLPVARAYERGCCIWTGSC